MAGVKAKTNNTISKGSVASSSRNSATRSNCSSSIVPIPKNCAKINISWANIDWKVIDKKVRRLQERIYKASKANNKGKVRCLQERLLRGLNPSNTRYGRSLA